LDEYRNPYSSNNNNLVIFMEGAMYIGNISITAFMKDKQPSSRRRPGSIGADKAPGFLDSGLRRNDE
jgi:hypothetical protein